jgi:hypothetical protein
MAVLTLNGSQFMSKVFSIFIQAFMIFSSAFGTDPLGEKKSARQDFSPAKIARSARPVNSEFSL